MNPLDKTYRVSLTGLEVMYLLNITKTKLATTGEPLASSLAKKLTLYKTKIDMGALAGRGIEPSPSLLASLGGSSETPTSIELPKETIWLNAYTKYLENSKDWSTLSVSEIEAAKEHMYLNFLMTPEEVAEFESPKS